MIEFIEIDKLELLERNPRKITESQFKKLCKSLKEDPSFFERRPCLVNRVNDTLTIYAGNMRVRAAKELGWSQVPCVVDDELSETKMKSRSAKDNKTYGEWDYEILSCDYEIDELIDIGFTSAELGVGFKLDDEEKPKEDKKKKKCPHCGEEI
jgi:ParB-like chromosome segregation protein Spo0J